MNKIEELFHGIREVCNHPWKKELLYLDKVKWNKLWSSLDVIEDSQIAIEDYNNLPDFNSNQKGYLYTYGILQALNLQQDALRSINKALFEEDIDFKTEYPSLYIIRENRNNSIGHPTNRMNGKSFHHIGRSSICKKGFKMISYFPKGNEESMVTKINILSCIKTQESLLTDILKKTMKKLEADVESHKSKFKNKKLADLIPHSTHYHFSKLYEYIHREYELIEINYNTIFETYEQVKDGIIERYTSLSALENIELITEKLDYLFKRVKRDLIDKKIDDQLELTIFIDALKSNFKELEGMINEIDKEFNE